MNNLDAGTIATIAAPVLAVLIWLLDYFFRQHKKLLIEVHEPRIVNPEIEDRDTKLLVEHRGVTLDNPVFMQSVRLWNVGNKDILLSPDHDTAEIHTKNGATILSANASLAREFRFVHQERKDPNILTAHWKIMKPKEWANVHFVLSVPHDSSALWQDGYLKPVFRIQDVRLVYDSELNRRRSVFWTGTFIIALLAFVFFSVSASFLPISRQPAYETSPGKHEVIRGFSEGGTELCSLETGPFTASSCRTVLLAQLKDFGEPKEMPGHTRKNPLGSLLYTLSMLLLMLLITNFDYARMEYRAFKNSLVRREDSSPFKRG